MSKEQWGHGFHTGKAAAKKEMKRGESFPVGYFFLTHGADGNVEHQGKVTGRNGDTLLVRYFSWIDGHLMDKVFPFDMADTSQWEWYDTEEDMASAPHNEWEEIWKATL